MKIVELRAKNVKRLKAVEVRPDGNGGLVVIGGRNDQGKTSVLDSIVYALGGMDRVPPEPIRKGEKSAKIEVLLDGAGVEVGPFKVTRSFTKSGGYLTVEDSDGRKFPSPQKMLDEFVGLLSFDPLAFAQMDGKEQRATLLKVVKLDIDLDENAGKRQAAYDRRTEVNRDLKQMKAVLDDIPTPPADTPDEEISLVELTKAYQDALAQNRQNEQLRRDFVVAGDREQEMREQVKNIEDQLKQAKDKLDGQVKWIRDMGPGVKALVDVDVVDLQQQAGQVGETNTNVRQKKDRQAKESELKKAEAVATKLTDEIGNLDSAKEQALEAAQFPVEGLSVTEDGVTYGDVPFEQLSSSEQLRVGVGIAAALNPTLRVLRIDNGSLLDSESMERLREWACEHDYDVWIERVGDQDKMAIVIEDGAVKASA